MVSREGDFLTPPSVTELRRDLLGKSSSSAKPLCWLASLQGKSVGCREWGWSKRVLFSNDWNVVGYVIGILILLQKTEGCKGLFMCQLVELSSSSPPIYSSRN